MQFQTAVVEDGVQPHSHVQPQVRELRVQFTGTAQEYFRIWIVNTLLTIVTLGVYSAWAKVRTKQYFYRNTVLDGTSFEYLANPIQVLKGRLIAAAALAALFGSQYYSPVLYGVVVLLLLLASPWVFVKALAFNARNSAFRNIRFAFAGRVGEAAGLYFGMMLLHVFTCGLAYPYVQWRLTSFAVWRHYYGDQQFTWVSKSGDYYRAYLLALAMTLPAYLVLFGVIAAAADPGNPGAMSSLMVPLTVFIYAYLLIPGAFLRAKLSNLLYGGTRIGQHELACDQRGVDVLKLYAVNALAIVVSLGLLIPWAKIRLAQYRASRLTLLAFGSLSAAKLLDDQTNAVGEGLSDLGDFDVGIGV